MSKEIQDLFFIAQTQSEIGRFQDMIVTMKKIIDLNPQLTHDQRVLLSVSYHDFVSEKRQNLLVLESCIEQTESYQQKEIMQDICNEIREKIHKTCKEVIDIIKNRLLPNNTDRITQLFYYKMAADYYRYIAETKTGDEKSKIIDKTEGVYMQAIEIGKESLLCSHPLFLGLILNFCVFLVDIKGDKVAARELAQEVMKLAGESADEYPDLKGETEICIKLLNDNLEIWDESE